MLKKTIKYTDYNGVEREETFYFNLNKAELLQMELGTTGGLGESIKRLTETQDVPELMRLFKKFILQSYGIKSEDGRRFVKSEELSAEFEQTPAFEALYMELVTDDKAGADFMNGIVPKDVMLKAQELDAQGMLPA